MPARSGASGVTGVRMESKYQPNWHPCVVLIEVIGRQLRSRKDWTG
jgi:hypothetical protein